MNTTFAIPAFAAADERAFDRAVRRLPGFWTWDYVADVGGFGTATAVISPPWGPSQEAFHVFCRPGEPFRLESALDGRASGEYADLDHMLRGIRAVVMGDPFDRNEPSPAEPDHPVRKTAKGRPIALNNRDLTSEDFHTIESTLYAWDEAGFCPLHHEGNVLLAAWDERIAAFVFERDGAAIRLTDNLTVNQRSNATGTFSSVSAALAAVWCVIRGDFDSAVPEIQQFFDVRLGRAAA